MARIITRYILINKRLFKRLSFVVILCLVPCLVAGLKLVSHQESGILQIAIYLSNTDDEISKEIVSQVLDRNQLIQYTLCESEAEARELVKNFDADAAWIFPDNMKKSLAQSVLKKKNRAVVTVVEREDTVPLVLSREILCSCIYPYFSYEIFRNFVCDDLGIEYLSEKELRKAYNATLLEDNFFEMTYIDGQSMEKSSYLLTPVRGLLAVWLVLCGFAGMMYFLMDEQKGVYTWIPVKKRLGVAYGTCAVLLSDAAIVMLVSCNITGIAGVWYREIGCLVIYSISVLGFTGLIRLLCHKLERLGSVIPFILIIMVILCPVFIDVKIYKPVQLLLPPYYYLKSIHSDVYFYAMAIYAVVLIIVCRIIYIIDNKNVLICKK